MRADRTMHDKERDMPRIDKISPGVADPATQDILNSIRTKVGMLPNLHATLAHAPAALRGYLALGDMLAQGELSSAQREIVSIATAQANGCQYCLSAHTMLGKGAGLDHAAIHDARVGAAGSSANHAIGQFVHRLVEARGNISDADLVSARNAGLNDRQILEIVANVAMNVLTNFTNNVCQTVVDFPVVDLDEVA